MRKANSTRGWRYSLLGGVLLVLGLGPMSGAVLSNEVSTHTLVRSWIDIPAPVFPHQEGAPALVRSRMAKVDFETVRYQDRIHFNLFESVDLYATKRYVEVRGPRSYSWFGDLEGVADGFAIVTVIDDAVAAVAKVGSRIFRIGTRDDGNQLVEEYLEDQFPDCGGEVHPPEMQSHIPMSPAPADTAPRPDFDDFDLPETQAIDDGSNIDVLIVYTPAARTAGGNIAVTMQLAVDQTNMAYQNSGVDQRVTLVHTEEVQYTESGSGSTDLARLRDPFDGNMDGVHDLRDEYCADLVHLWVVRAAGICGIAYVQSPEAPGFRTSAFGVEVVTCEPGTFTTAHEMGHNMGLTHDRANGSGGAYAWAFGYQEPAGRFRTVMAYQNGCAIPTGCPTIPNFSNPDVDWSGQPTGVPIGEPLQAHNVDALNRTADTTSRFRDSEPCFVPNCQEDPYEPDTQCHLDEYSLLDGDSSRDLAHCADAVDYVLFGARAGESYTVRTTNHGVSSDTSIMLLEGDCFTFVDQDDSGGVGEQDMLTYDATEDVCMYVRLAQASGEIGVGKEYTLEVDGNQCPEICLDPTATCDGGGGLVPPFELKFDAAAGTIVWQGNGSQDHNVYRGSLDPGLVGFGFDNHTCHAQSVNGLLTLDSDTDELVNSSAYLFYYLVSATDGVTETDLGDQALEDGSTPARPNNSPCQ